MKQLDFTEQTKSRFGKYDDILDMADLSESTLKRLRSNYPKIDFPADNVEWIKTLDELSDRIAFITFSKENWDPKPLHEFLLDTYAKELYKGERFYKEPTVGTEGQSAFFISNDWLITAKHGFQDTVLEETQLSVLRGFQRSDKGETKFKQYDIERVVHVNDKSSSTPDISLVKIKGGANSLEDFRFFGRRQDYQEDVGLFTICHPFGMLKKFIPGGMIQKLRTDHFYCDLDLYTGSSGAPVFSFPSGRLIGVVSGGAPDFQKIDGAHKWILKWIDSQTAARGFDSKTPYGQKIQIVTQDDMRSWKKILN